MNLKKSSSDFSSAKSNVLSTNHSQRSYIVDSKQQMASTPSFVDHRKQAKFLHVTGKIIRELNFNLQAATQKQEEKQTILDRIGKLCNCVKVEKETSGNEPRASRRVDLSNLLSAEESLTANKALTPIGSLANLLRE